MPTYFSICSKKGETPADYYTRKHKKYNDTNITKYLHTNCNHKDFIRCQMEEGYM